MSDFFQTVLDVIAANPEWAGAIIFLTGVIETIIVIGYLIPGTWMMLGYGFLVGTGALRFDVAMIAMTTSGVIGDAIGYWIGRRYGRRLFKLRWFEKHWSLVVRAENFFARHGGKAVFLARALGPVRPLVPFFAGLAHMHQGKFTIYNIASALLGSLVYLLPGIAISLGVQFTGAMTWRLVIFIVLIVTLVWLSRAAARRGASWVTARAPTAAARLHEWARSPRRQLSAVERAAAWALVPFVDPRHRASVAIGALGAGALGAFAGMIVLLSDVVIGDPIAHANGAVLNFLRGLSTPWADDLMGFFAALGEAAVLLPLVGAVLLLLLVRRDWVVMSYWALSAAFAALTALILEKLIPAPEGASLDVTSFPSAHAAISVIVIGYLAILCLPTVNVARGRALILFAAFVYVSLIGLAQLYLGQVLVSSLVCGLLLGLGWLIVLTVVTLRHIPRPSPRWGRLLGLTAAAVIVVAATANAILQKSAPFRPLEIGAVQRLVDGAAWKGEGWRALPVYRSDFVGRRGEPFNVQIAAPPEAVRRLARAAGWEDPPEWNAFRLVALLTAAGNGAGADDPVLPRFWDGKAEALALVKRYGEGRLILRLWDEGYRLVPSGVPLLVGTVESEQPRPAIVFGSIHLPPRAADFDRAAGTLAEDLGGRLAYREPEPERNAEWSGAVALWAAPGWTDASPAVNNAEARFLQAQARYP